MMIIIFIAFIFKIDKFPFTVDGKAIRPSNFDSNTNQTELFRSERDFVFPGKSSKRNKQNREKSDPTEELDFTLPNGTKLSAAGK